MGRLFLRKGDGLFDKSPFVQPLAEIECKTEVHCQIQSLVRYKKIVEWCKVGDNRVGSDKEVDCTAMPVEICPAGGSEV